MRRTHRKPLRLLLDASVKGNSRLLVGSLLEPISALGLPAIAGFVKLLTDGVVNKNDAMLSFGVFGLAGSVAMRHAFSWFGAQYRNALAEKVGFNLESRIAQAISSPPGLEHIERPEFQDEVSLVLRERALIGRSVNQIFLILGALIQAGVSTVLLASVDTRLIGLVGLAAPSLAIAGFTQKWAARAENESAAHFRLLDDIDRLAGKVGAGKETRVFGLEKELLARRDRAAYEACRSADRATWRAGGLQVFEQMVVAIGFAAAALFIISRLRRGLVSPGDVLLVLLLIAGTQQQVVAIFRGFGTLLTSLRATGRLVRLEDYANESKKRLGGSRVLPDQLLEGVRFENVSFRYPGTSRWVLKNVSCTLPIGSTVALVGENGSGKTTMLKLLAGFYSPDEGRVLVDGVNLQELDIATWRRRMSVAYQDFARFEFTLKDSVSIGDLAHLDNLSVIRNSLARADAAELETRLPNGLETQLGTQWEGGVDLSTGQWQKVALARGFMRGQSVITLLDEPTSNLDAIAEERLYRHVIDTLKEVETRPNLTIIVSHRFSTLRSANLILVMEDGSIVERGSHHELCQSGGLYAQNYFIQAKGYIQ